MALTLREQIQVAKGEPIQGLSQLLHAGAVSFASGWATVQKVFDTVFDDTDPQNPVAINQDAQGYFNKVQNKCTQILNLQTRKDGGVINDIMAMFAVVINEEKPAVTYSQIEGANDTQIEGFVIDVMPTIVERLAGTTKKEKQAYDLI